MKKLLLALVVVVVSGCSPPCSPFSTTPDQVCSSDAGAPQAGQSFTLIAQVYTSAGGNFTCSVAVDGGLIALNLDGSACSGNSNKPVAITSAIPCEVPALPAGRYTVTSRQTNATIDLADAGGSGITACP